MERIRLVLVDDHQVVIDGILGLFRETDPIEVVGVFTRGEDALHFLESQPQSVHVLLADLRMRRGIGGLELALQTRAKSPGTKVIVLTTSESPDDIRAAIRVGVSGFLFKSQDVQDIRTAVYEVMRSNRPYFSQEVLRTFAELGDEKHPEEVRQLTPRELEILKLIAQEHSTAAIAEKLFISEATVDTHRRNLIQKLKVKSIVGLANFAIRNGLV